MSKLAIWLQGSRPKTWANPFASVIAGIAAALSDRAGISFSYAVLILVTALSLTIGVNFANDYSDGIKGTDSLDRIGPTRLVGSQNASAKSVKVAAWLSIMVAALSGLSLCWLIHSWALLLIGLLSILALWSYTGGPLSFGYRGFGELAAFIFYGLVGVVGTQYALTGAITLAGIIAAVCVGCFSAAILAINNLRDITNDQKYNKKTFAVRFGAQATRVLISVLLGLIYLLSWVLIGSNPWNALLLFIGLSFYSIFQKLYTDGNLIEILGKIAKAMLIWAIILLIAVLLYR